MGYLHICSSCLRWSSSLLSNCGLEQTGLALCVKVLVTLNLTARLWLLSHSKYRSVWVGFLYTLVVKELSGSGITRVSKKGMDPSALVSSTVKLMFGSMLLMCLWSLSFLDNSMTTKCHPHISPKHLEDVQLCLCPRSESPT